jgi:hypothetical protein
MILFAVGFNTPPQILRANLFAANLRPLRRLKLGNAYKNLVLNQTVL